LNREFNQIEEPYRPVIRMATPVFYANTAPGNEQCRAGIVVINISRHNGFCVWKD
jgi:hypothetical protein